MAMTKNYAEDGDEAQSLVWRVRGSWEDEGEKEGPAENNTERQIDEK